MTATIGPEPTFTMGEMEALSKIKPTPYLDEADLSRDDGYRMPGPDVTVRLSLTPDERAWYEKQWRAAFGLD